MLSQVDCDKLLQLLNKKVVFVDIRRNDDFIENHLDLSSYKEVKGINLAFSKYRDVDNEPNFISLLLANNVDQQCDVVLMCYKGISSQSAAQLLSDYGYKNVFSVYGGFDAVSASVNFNTIDGTDSNYLVIL